VQGIDKVANNEKSFIDSGFHLRKCEYCWGRDGKEKDIYETVLLAFDAAVFIEDDKEIFLNIYECPHGNGWHLTKNNAYSSIRKRKRELFQNNNISLQSTNGLWEYIRNETSDATSNNAPKRTPPKLKTSWDKPILKKECNAAADDIILSGKVMEIIKDVNIEKIFRINLQNAFCASMIKNVLDGVIDQITIYVDNREDDKLESYTILLKSGFLKNNKVKKGEQIKISVTGTSINDISVWRCKKILK
jgi:hypothetical protein